MELKEELKKGGLMALTAVIMLLCFAAIGACVKAAIEGEGFYWFVAIVLFILLVFAFFRYFNKKEKEKIAAKKAEDEAKKKK